MLHDRIRTEELKIEYPPSVYESISKVKFLFLFAKRKRKKSVAWAGIIFEFFRL